MREVLEEVEGPGDSPIFTFTGDEKAVVTKLDKEYDYVDVDGHGKVKITERGKRYLEKETRDKERSKSKMDDRITEADRISKRSSAQDSLKRIENATGNFLYSAMKDLVSTAWMYAENTENVKRSYKLYQLVDNMVILLEEIKDDDN